MKHRVVFAVFLSLIGFVVVLQLPLWFIVIEKHGARQRMRVDDDGSNDVVAPDVAPTDSPVDEYTGEQPPALNDQRAVPRSQPVLSATIPGLSIVCVNNVSQQQVRNASDGTAIVAFHLDTVDEWTMPWELLAELDPLGNGKVHPGQTEIGGTVDVLLVTSLTPEKWRSIVTKPTVTEPLLALGFDPRTLSYQSAYPLASVVVQVHLIAFLHGSSVLHPATAERNGWHVLPLVATYLASVWRAAPNNGGTVIYMSPHVDTVTIPWHLLATDAVSRCLHDPRDVVAAINVCDRNGAIISAGVTANLGDFDEVVLSNYLAGFDALDARAGAPGSVWFVTPYAFATTLRALLEYWPTSSIATPIPWQARTEARDGSLLFCLPEQNDFVAFMHRVTTTRGYRGALRTGVSVSLNRGESAFHFSCRQALDAAHVHPDGGDLLRDILVDDIAMGNEWTNIVQRNILSGRQADAVLVEWDTFCIPCFGFTNEVMAFLVPLEQRLYVHTLNEATCFCHGTPVAFQEALIRLASTRSRKQLWSQRHRSDEAHALNGSGVVPLLVHVSHKDPGSFPRFSPATRPDIVIGRAMYEFTKIPQPWLAHKDDVDEVWVPCRFVRWVFERAGFPASKLYVMPEPIDVFQYDRSVAGIIGMPPTLMQWNQAGNPMLNGTVTSAATTGRFKFFSVFKWEDRKGWEILLEAYCRAFKDTDPVSLYLSTYIYGEGRDASHVLGRIEKFVRRISVPWESAPHIHVISEQLSEHDMIALYNSADAFVMPTKGEGWGLPAIQAMSMALPTIVTNWSGIVDFATPENSYLIPISRVEELPFNSPYGYETGKLWAVPDVDALQELLVHVVDHPMEARLRGMRARQDVVAQFSSEAVAVLVEERVLTLARMHRKSHQEKLHDAVNALLDDHHLII